MKLLWLLSLILPAFALAMEPIEKSVIPQKQKYIITDYGNREFSLTQNQHEALLLCQSYGAASSEDQISHEMHADFSGTKNPYLTKKNIERLADCLNDYHICGICHDPLQNLKLYQIKKTTCCNQYFCASEIKPYENKQCPLCKHPNLHSEPIVLIDLVKNIPDEIACDVFDCANYLGAPKHIMQALAHKVSPQLNSIGDPFRKQILTNLVHEYLSLGSYVDEYQWATAFFTPTAIDISFNGNKIVNLNGIEKLASRFNDAISTVYLDNQWIETFDIKKLVQIFANLRTLSLANNKIKKLAREQFDGMPDGFSLDLKRNPIADIERGFLSHLDVDHAAVELSVSNELLQKAGLSQETPEKVILGYLEKMNIGKFKGIAFPFLGIVGGTAAGSFMLNKAIMMAIHNRLGFTNYLVPAYYLLSAGGAATAGAISAFATTLTFESILNRQAPIRIRVHNGDNNTWYVFPNIANRLLAHFVLELRGHLKAIFDTGSERF